MGHAKAEVSVYEQEIRKALDALFWAFRNLPQHVQVVPLAPMVKRAERRTRKTGAKTEHPNGTVSFEVERFGRIIVDVPEQIALELRANPEHRPLFLLVRVSSDAVKRFESPIFTPTEH